MRVNRVRMPQGFQQTGNGEPRAHDSSRAMPYQAGDASGIVMIDDDTLATLAATG